MKKLMFSLLTLGLSLTVCLAQNSASPAAEEAAIKKVIEAESAAFDAADYKAYLSYWAKVPYASYLIFGEQYVGDALWKQLDKVWEGKKPVKTKKIRTNWNIHTKGETSFVTFNQRSENQEDNIVSESAESRYMEKINGQWKIVNVTAMWKPAK